jgi:hypothetical protein
VAKVMREQPRHELPKVLRGIAPEVGSVWRWEPEKPHARCTVVVTAVTWNGEECWVETVALDDDRAAWNSLDRWVEATVFLAESTDHFDASSDPPISTSQGQR